MFLTKSLTLLQTKFKMKTSAKFIFSGLILALSSCGFTPLYKSQELDSTNICDNFTVESTHFEEIAREVKYPLQDRLNRSCTNIDQNYIVKLSLDKSEEPVSIQKDREVTRYNVSLNIRYDVVENGEDLFSGNKRLIGGYDAVTSDYGTYIQEVDTAKKLAQEMSNDIALKILSRISKTSHK